MPNSRSSPIARYIFMICSINLYQQNPRRQHPSYRTGAAAAGLSRSALARASGSAGCSRIEPARNVTLRNSRDRAGAECRAGVYSSQTGRCPSGLPGTVSGPVPFRNSNGGTTNWLISFAEQYMNKGRFFGGRSLLAGSVVALRRSRPAICDAPARSLGSKRMVRSVYSNSNNKKERFVYQWPAC